MFKVLAQKDIASPLAHYISRSLPDESEVKQLTSEFEFPPFCVREIETNF